MVIGRLKWTGRIVPAMACGRKPEAGVIERHFDD
jgi:hypothetical protein